MRKSIGDLDRFGCSNVGLNSLGIVTLFAKGGALISVKDRAAMS
jgi:hypothetical protein